MKKKSHWHYYYLHLTDEEMEAQKVWETRNQIHAYLALKPVFLTSMHAVSLMNQSPEKSSDFKTTK